MNKLHSLNRTICADFRNGIVAFWHKYLILFIIMILASFATQQQLETLMRLDGIRENVSLIESILNTFRGIKEFKSGFNNVFDIPLIFVFFILFLSFIIGDYAVKDTKEFGVHMLMQNGSRLNWWISKCLWVVITVVLYFVVAFAGVAVSWLMSSNRGTLFGLNSAVCRCITRTDNIIVDSSFVVTFILVMVITCIAICLFQMLLAIYTSPVVGFGAVALLCIVSAYSMKDWLIGNYMMLLRYIKLDASIALIIDILLIIVVSICGYRLFRKKDLR